MKMLAWLGCALAILAPAPLAAQAVLPQVLNAGASHVPSQAALSIDASGNALLGVAPSVALAGTASTTTTLGPFTPQLGRSIWLTLSGTWTGTVQVLRSTDGGTTTNPITVGGITWASFSANAQEPVSQESATGATYYLAITVSSGAVVYRLAQ